MAMSSSLRPYVTSVRTELAKALCIVNFPCQQVERHNRPEIEYDEDPELILDPVELKHREGEVCLIEASINSVRVSLKFRQSDPLEALLTKKYLAALMQKADVYDIVRRVPVSGYDVSFLITHRHCEAYDRPALAGVVCQFIEDTHAEVSDLKLALRSRNRQVASDYKKALVLPQLVAKYNTVLPRKAPTGSPV